MHSKFMTYALVAAGAVVVGLVLAGTPVASLLPFVLLLACPLMMVFMMRAMGHGPGDPHSGAHEGCGHDHGQPADTESRVDTSARH